MHTTTHMHKLTTQYATISFFYFLLHIINCHIIRISIVHDNCKQPVYTPLQQTWLNRSTYGVPFEISYRISIVHDNCKQLVYTPLQQTWLNRSTYGVPFEISYREKVQDFFLVNQIPINEVCDDKHVVQVLYGRPSIRCHTNPLPNKSPSQNIHLTRINFHTSPCNCSAMGNMKPRLNYFHKFLKTLMLHKFKR